MYFHYLKYDPLVDQIFSILHYYFVAKVAFEVEWLWNMRGMVLFYLGSFSKFQAGPFLDTSIVFHILGWCGWNVWKHNDRNKLDIHSQYISFLSRLKRNMTKNNFMNEKYF